MDIKTFVDGNFHYKKERFIRDTGRDGPLIDGSEVPTHCYGRSGRDSTTR